MTVKTVRIRIGAGVWQDFRWFTWMSIKKAEGPQIDPYMLFRATITGNRCACTADGFGFGVRGEPAGAYGNGALMVDVKDVIEVTEAEELGLVGGYDG